MGLEKGKREEREERDEIVVDGRERRVSCFELTEKEEVSCIIIEQFLPPHASCDHPIRARALNHRNNSPNDADSEARRHAGEAAAEAGCEVGEAGVEGVDGHALLRSVDGALDDHWKSRDDGDWGKCEES